MPTATIKKALQVAQQATAAHGDLCQAYDELCMAKARAKRDGEEIDLALEADISILLGALDKSVHDHTSDVNRCGSVLRHQAIAGSKRDRAAAKKERDTAKKKLADEEPAIREQISTLQGQLDSLQSDHEKKSDVVRCQEQAIASLQKSCPPHIQNLFDRMRGQVKAKYTQDIGPLETRLSVIDKILALHWRDISDPDHKTAAMHGKHQNSHLVTDSKYGVVVNDDAWQAYRNELEAERPGIIDELAPLKKSLNSELEKLEALKDHYVPA